MFLSTLKAIYYYFYPLESNDARKRQRISKLQRVQKHRRTIQKAKRRTATANTSLANTDNAHLRIKPSLLEQASKRIRKCRCPGCGLRVDRNRESLHYRRQKLPGLCSACKRMLKLAKGDLNQRFKQPKKQQDCKRHHEAKFIQNLHKIQGGKDSIFTKVDLYHLPLSTNYYRKLNKEDFVHHISYPNHNTVFHFNTCQGCRLFVSSRRRTLLHATQRSWRRRGDVGKVTSREVVSVQDLFRIMVSSNSSCAFSGTRGVWHSFAKGVMDPLYSLSLDHKVPLSKGGSSTIDNLQVSLVCLNEVKNNHINKQFLKWWNAFRRKQGYF